jgi:hypothetical protein
MKPPPPRIIALLAWYDEPKEWLTRCVDSLARLPVDHLIAVDGSYALYPHPAATSDRTERIAIANAAARNGIRYDIHTPLDPWPGEVEKRNFLFQYAETHARPIPGDWYFVIDADEFVTHSPDDVPARLAATPFDVGATTLREPGHPMGTMIYPTHPKFFRAIRGLRTVLNHYTYTAPDGRKLWGNAKTDHLEPRADLTAITVEHHNQLRHPDRYKAAKTYYRTRDAQGVEELPPDRSILRDAA